MARASSQSTKGSCGQCLIRPFKGLKALEGPYKAIRPFKGLTIKPLKAQRLELFKGFSIRPFRVLIRPLTLKGLIRL